MEDGHSTLAPTGHGAQCSHKRAARGQQRTAARCAHRWSKPPSPAPRASCFLRLPREICPLLCTDTACPHVQRDKYPAPHRLGTRSHRLHVWRRPAEASTSASTSAIVIPVSRLGMLSRYDGVMWYTKWLARNHSPSAPSGALTSPSVLSHPGSEHTAPRTPAIPTTFPAAAPQKISLRTRAVAICGAREASVNINKEVD